MDRFVLLRGTANLLLLAAVCLAPATLRAQSKPVFPLAVRETQDPLLTGLTIPPTAPTMGMWSSTQNWPLVSIHMAVTPDGHVLSLGTPLGQGVQDGRTLDLWDPALGFTASSHLDIANGQLVDSFCGTAAILPGSGTILVSGGGSSGDGYTSFASTNVTPSLATAVNAGATLAAQRWYGTMITLANGQPLMMGGSTPYTIVNAYADPTDTLPYISITPEIYTPGIGWQSLLGATSTDAFGPVNNRAWYPRAWVTPSGKVFGLSTEKMWLLDPVANSIVTLGDFKTTVDNTTLPNVGPTSTAVMYDTGKIMQLGGNGYNNGYPSPSSPYASLFDITVDSAPVVTDTNPLNYPRQWANSLVLPDGEVLVTGGSTYADNGGANAVYPAELWSAATGNWRVGASAANYRGYHSSTLLMPDGVVLSAGGGVPGPVSNLNAEIYYPPYLFSTRDGQAVLARRPRIVSLSTTTTNYGGAVSVQVDNVGKVAGVSLIGLSDVTHGFNTFQRRMNVGFRQKAGVLNLTMPASANLAPPGYYLLTVLNRSGVPSGGVIMALGAAPAPQRSITAILPVDGAARSIASSVAPGYVVRQSGYVAYMNAISPQSPNWDRDDASFYTQTGFADSTCYAFQSKTYPEYFLTQSKGQMVLGPNDGSTRFAKAATFCAVAGLSGTGFSLQSYGSPKQYLHTRTQTQEMWLDVNDGSTQFAQTATFYLAEEYLPVDSGLHAFGNLTLPGTLVRHQNFQGYLSYINAASSAGDIADSSFHVRAGNANNACYSFESSNYPGYFLRHQNFVLYLQQNDGSTLFALDSTFCLQAGLGGQGFSLSSVNYPTYNLRQSGGTLILNTSDGSAQFSADATFSLLPAP